MGHPEDIGLLRSNRIGVGGPEGPRPVMKYTTRLNLEVGIGYRVVLTSTATFITSEVGTLVNYTTLIMFAVVLYINMNIESSSYTGLFPWHASGGACGQGQSEFHCLSPLSYAPGLPTVHFSPHHSSL